LNISGPVVGSWSGTAVELNVKRSLVFPTFKERKEREN
jgi:hypothetical protein